MNSQRGKASTQASKSSNGRQVTKTKTNGNKRSPNGAPAQKQSSAAAAYATTQKSGKAQVLRDTVDSCRIVHRELVTSLTGSVAFTVQNALAINPGISNTFPWLSIEAQGWEKYRFNSLKVCSYTRTGSTTPGSIILSPDYDASDQTPVNESIACASYSAIEDAPWKDICCNLDKARLKGDRFVRTGALASNQDIKMYDVANVNVCTVDGTAVGWSKIWVEYDIVLMNPQLPPGGPQGSGTLAGLTAITAANPFGTAPVTLGSYNLTGASTNVLSWTGLSIGTEYAIFTGSAGTVISAYAQGTFTGATVKSSLSAFNAAATTGMHWTTFTATASSGSLVLSVTATTITLTDVVLSALSPTPSF